MNKGSLQRLGLFFTFLFALACCASVPNSPEPQAAHAPQKEGELKLRIVYSADTKGNYEPCPT